ncbi:uncharacterized protein C22orf15-like isoform X1 [Polyodon spathula]|uniref:uncharacterized protein C22orf15-like isoform X1 n=1 Tax=Polyodon spathula TaxID=7913 RepID=UPI001B7DCA9A|nr:uncharacterized protein C22orf15-like isoform X1 [Polyodon spathula]
MFITVKFGEDQKEIFNPNCRIINFIHSLKERCNCMEEVCIDLLDESGALVNLSERENSPDFASSFLKERHRYILLKVIRGDGGEGNKYESLLLNLGKCHPDLADVLQKLSNPQRDRERKNCVSRKGRQHKDPPSTHPHTKNKTPSTSKKNSNINHRT